MQLYCIVQTLWFYFHQQKQIQTLNKLCSNLLEKLNNPRDDRDAESAGVLRSHRPDSSSQVDFYISTSILPSFMSCMFFQRYDRTSRPSTLLTLTLWSELLHLERGSLNVGLQVQWPLDIQDKGPWWVEARPYSRSPSAVAQASKQVWEDLWLHSSKGSQVGDLESWVSIPPDCSQCLLLCWCYALAALHLHVHVLEHLYYEFMFFFILGCEWVWGQQGHYIEFPVFSNLAHVFTCVGVEMIHIYKKVFGICSVDRLSWQLHDCRGCNMILWARRQGCIQQHLTGWGCYSKCLTALKKQHFYMIWYWCPCCNQKQTCSRSFAPKSEKRGELLWKDNSGIVSQSLAWASIYFISAKYLTDFDNVDEATPVKTDPERFQSEVYIFC